MMKLFIIVIIAITLTLTDLNDTKKLEVEKGHSYIGTSVHDYVHIYFKENSNAVGIKVLHIDDVRSKKIWHSEPLTPEDIAVLPYLPWMEKYVELKQIFQSTDQMILVFS